MVPPSESRSIPWCFFHEAAAIAAIATAADTAAAAVTIPYCSFGCLLDGDGNVGIGQLLRPSESAVLPVPSAPECSSVSQDQHTDGRPLRPGLWAMMGPA